MPRWLWYVQESYFWRVILSPLWSVQWAHPHKDFDTGCDIWIEASTLPAEPCSPLRHGGARGLRRRRQSVATSGARNSHISYIQRPVNLKSNQVGREGREFCEILCQQCRGCWWTAVAAGHLWCFPQEHSQFDVLCVNMSHPLQHLVATFLPELHSMCLPLMAITPQLPLSILQR